MSPHTPNHRVDVLGPPGARHGEILTPEALDFVSRLDSAFAVRRAEILTARRHHSDRLASGSPLDFPRATSAVRDDPHWQVAPPAPDLTDRRVEITGPPTPRTAARALGSGARVWVASFEDTASSLWEAVVGGQSTLLDVCQQHIGFTTTEDRSPRLGTDLPAIVVRPRGWHLEEEHLKVEGRPLSASLVDFGLYFFHCARHRIDNGSGPYFSLSGLENRYEARLWNDVFLLAQDLLGVPRGTIRATAVVDTVTAAFEMEEILYELREHSSGLTADRWNYLFSVIRTFGHRIRFLLPDRTDVTMNAPFIRAYTGLLVHTCHRRGGHAISDGTEHLPGKDPASDRTVPAKARRDKEHEAAEGFDGARVDRPALVPVCRAVFDEALADHPHRIRHTHHDVRVGAADLLAGHRHRGLPPTGEDIAANVAVALSHIHAWLRGRGKIAPDGPPEDAANGEIARARLWQWRRQRLVSSAELRESIDVASASLSRVRPGPLVPRAREILQQGVAEDELPSFLTPDAYLRLVRRTAASS